MKCFRFLHVIFLFTAGLIACTIRPVDAELTWEEELRALNLSEEQIDTLLSLEQVDEFPLYTMQYFAPYETVSKVTEYQHSASLTFNSPWGCSLFTALADPENLIFGRNFDWEYSPALLLFTDPPDGYASAAMVDIKYLGYWHENAGTILEESVLERLSLLDAPYLPFDGINETGLAVGMAAVPSGNMPVDPDKETVDSLLVIREILDHARHVDEAIDILARFNIDYGNGPALHYLIADLSGESALVEFYQGEMRIIYNKFDWHQATNFLVSSVDEQSQGHCWRYDKILDQLSGQDGNVSVAQAFVLLEGVAQESTQWSVVYEMSTGDINIVMGKAYNEVHELHLDLLSE